LARKLAVITLEHQCAEDPCHLQNDAQATWLEQQLRQIAPLTWNWRISRVRVVDVVGEDT
jgi:hypothetical protein